ncbi:MAG: hypothetical protein AAGC95_08505 [Pseudomonadota bacterium]
MIHVAAVAAAFVALPSNWRAAEPPPVFVPIELVAIDDLTSVPAAAPEPEETPVEEPAAEEEPAPVEVAEAPPPEPEPVEEPEVFIPDPEEDVAEAPEPEEPKEPESKPIDPKRLAAVTPKPKPKKDDLDFGRLSALIDKAQKDEPAPRAAPKQAPAAAPAAAQADTPRPQAGLGLNLTLSEEDALRSAMYRCWTVPAGAPEPEKLVVRVRVKLNRDGSLQGQPEVLDRGRINASGDPYLRLAAESAQRAVLRCAPYNLPADKYDGGWEEITMTFNPADMVGR